MPLYFFISAAYERVRHQNIDCTKLGEENFVPNWTINYADRVTFKRRESGPSGTEFSVPNVVHYIWYADTPKPLKFHHLLSVLSAYQVIKPQAILFHTNAEPIGDYWQRVKNVPSLKVVHRKPSLCLFGYVIKVPYYETSSSNVDRLRVLYESGGIYLDLDVLVTKPFDDLRRYPCTVGLESSDRVCGGVVICARDAPFLTLWINSYLDDYRVTTWAYNSGKVPYHLWRRYPHLVHVEKRSMHRPNYRQLEKIYGADIVNWEDNYSVHLWYRVWKKSKLYKEEPNEINIRTMNSTFGQIARRILYGTTDFINSQFASATYN